MNGAKIDYLKNKYHYFLWNNPNIIGIGKGKKIIDGYMTHIPSITILVYKKINKDMLSKQLLIPSSIDGVLTDIIEMGIPRIARGEVRPAIAGIGIGNIETDRSGTIGYAVTEKETRKKLYILSCSHVLTRDYKGNKADRILQPAKVDKGEFPISYIASLADWVPVRLGEISKKEEYNEVDAAIALVEDNTSEKQKRKLLPKLIDGTIINDISDVEASNIVYKIGKSTNKTNGKVISTNTSIKVSDPKYGIISYRNQIVVKMLSKAGDSGALTIREDNGKAVGLLIAAVDDMGLSICSPINRVLDLLNIEIAKLL